MRKRVWLWSFSLAASCTALPFGVEARSLSGAMLQQSGPTGAAKAQAEADLAAAQAALAAKPGDREAAVWVGRRLGYLGRFREAIAVWSDALDEHPGDPFLLRHRGHRWITLREFGRAAADLERAAVALRTTIDEVEPDGRPVAGRPPHSTLHYNVHYHLGLALFLGGDFVAAERAWLDCLAVVGNDESRVAVTHWLWSVRMRLGDAAGASAVVAGIRPDLDVVENRGYHQLCLLYAGRLTAAEVRAGEGSSGAAVRFGLAHHELVLGNRGRALAQLRELARESPWSAFGVIAAEAEVARAAGR